ncbi:MAG: DUF87 domain-containing protein [Bryobacteraceae bacterium]|nr:DUF87 domain-containing protein [Bryobacteraceae bacterium]
MLPDLFRRLKPLYGQRVDALWIAYQLGSNEERREIEAALTILAVRKQGLAIGNDRIVLDPIPAPLALDGAFLLGHCNYPGLAPYPVLLSRRDLLRHIFLLGPSGTGKSTFIIGVLRQLLKEGIPFIAVDFKRNYRCLLHDEYGESVLVLSIGRALAPVRVNILQPPDNVSDAEWIEALTDIISNAYLLLQGARNVLKSALSEAHRAGGTLRAARDLLTTQLTSARAGSRRYGWLESSHRALDELSKDELGQALCAITENTITHLLSRPVVLELTGLGDDQKRAVCLYLLQYLLLLRKYQTAEREVLHHVMIFDEAHNVFPKEQWGELGVPSRLAREIREYGEAIISASQQGDVADSLIANSGTKIILRTDYPKDVELASKLLQVEPRWITKIPTGNAIIRLPSRYYQAFMISFPEQPIKNKLTNDETILASYAQSQPAAEAIPPTVNDPAPNVVSEKEHALLNDIATRPISTVTQRYERLRWNPKTGNAITARLLKRGLLAFTILPVHQGRVKILTLTTEGETYARNHHIKITSSGHAGIEHEFWRSRLQERCEARGYTVTREYQLGNGHRVDLLATRGPRRILIEIETGKSDISGNADKCQGHGHLIVFFTTTIAWRQHQKKLPTGVLAIYPDTIRHLHEVLNAFTTDRPHHT